MASDAHAKDTMTLTGQTLQASRRQFINTANLPQRPTPSSRNVSQGWTLLQLQRLAGNKAVVAYLQRYDGQAQVVSYDALAEDKRNSTPESTGNVAVAYLDGTEPKVEWSAFVG